MHHWTGPKRLFAVAAATGLASLSLLMTGGNPAYALPTTLTFVGHGWGHGEGMGQYGALGYALSGWSYQQILNHYYGGTVLINTAVPQVQVTLQELYGASSVAVSAPAGSFLTINGVTTSQTSATIQRGSMASSTNGADIVVSGAWSTGSQRSFSGSIQLPAGSGNVLNVVGLQQYVEGVVPRESPASWPAAALEAQAVAARSYALASSNNGTQPVCDTTFCQVYGGDPAQYANSYSQQSNAAVAYTGSYVLDCGQDRACGASGSVALTEFSSSTGGWTAGALFPAVVDAGDATPSNPNHDWSASVATSTVQSAFPSVGALQSVTVTSRNGDGDLGGRVLQMVLSGSAGQETVSGATFAGAIGLKSDWFAITDTGPAPGSESGYWVVSAAGDVYPYGAAPSYGSMAGYNLAAPVIGMAPTGDGAGYWLVGGDGGIFSFGDAHFYGSTGGVHLVAPVLDMASTGDSRGYWMVASDGGVFSFGDAHFYGSTGGVPLVQPVVAMARTGDGGGYWLVASDGGVFAFGDARYYGSAASFPLAAPIVGMVPTTDGRGYWLVASDGGVFAFGDAGFVGSLGGSGVTDVASVSPTPNDQGYLLVTRSGHVYAFGNAAYLGDPAHSVSGWSGTAIGVFTQ